MTSTSTRLVSLVVLALLAPAAAAGTWFVDANLTSGANDGSSWGSAFQGPDGLQSALTAAVAGDRIFVADGRYRPTSTGARGVSFVLRSGIELYGGFVGGESSPAERPPFGVAPSVLDGDLAGDDASGATGENSRQVVKAGSSDATAVLDGFVVRGGNADNPNTNGRFGAGLFCSQASPTVRNCHFIDNRSLGSGGAVYVSSGGPVFTDCTFENCRAGEVGGGLALSTGLAPFSIDRCEFIGNRAAAGGGLSFSFTSSVTVANSLFRGNFAETDGGAVRMGNGLGYRIVGCTLIDNHAGLFEVGGVLAPQAGIDIGNTIVWNNSGASGATGSANQIEAGQDVTYSIVEGGYPGAGNLALDPLLVGDGWPSLQSPAIDAGNNAATTGFVLDLAGGPRLLDAPSVPDSGSGTAPIVDIGAIEFRELAATAFCFGDGSGTACPCANAGASGEGCATSAGSGGRLAASGSAIVSDDDLVLLGTQLLPGQPALFFVGASQVGGGSGVVFGDGLRCAGGSVLRLGVALPNGGGTASFGPGLASAGGWQPGDTRHFQIWFRDPGGPCGSGFNLSNALSLTFQ